MEEEEGRSECVLTDTVRSKWGPASL